MDRFTRTWLLWLSALSHVLCLPALCALRCEGTPCQQLPLPPRGHSLETLSEAVTALLVQDTKIFYTPWKNNYIGEAPWNPTVTLGGGFHDLSQGKRYYMPHATSPMMHSWNALVETASKELVWFSGTFASLLVSSPKGAFIAQGSFVWDLIQPPHDSRGAPTQIELQRTRKQFLAALASTPQPAWVGFATMPVSWPKEDLPYGGDTESLLVATRIPEFPLVQMHCEFKKQFTCQVTRQCFLEDPPPHWSKHITGLAVSRLKPWVVIGDNKEHLLYVVHYESCLHSTLIKALRLPLRLKTLGGVYIDKQERLWVSTMQKDDYENASIFYWNKEDWYPALFPD